MRIAPGCVLWLTLAAIPAQAFDYLEHSFLTDRACLEAQRALIPHLDDNPHLLTRYLALALFCPERWDVPYCERGYKQVEASINRLESPPATSGDYAVTLGDYAAWPDHFSAWGPVRGIPQATRDGLMKRTFEWLSETSSAGGVEEDVGEDACEVPRPLDWKALEASLQAPALPSEDIDALLNLPSAPFEKAAEDPSGAYSFDNPHYLDLIRHNHAHFNPASHDAFLGFHQTALKISALRCEDWLALSAEDARALTRALPHPPPPEATACEHIEALIRHRIEEWQRRADPQLTAPVMERWSPWKDDPSRARALVPAFMSLVFEGAALHFLQDGFSGGHVRLQRAAASLQDSRYGHDLDSRYGVDAYVVTAQQQTKLRLYGDGYLLGGLARPPTEVSSLLVQHQRRQVLEVTEASLLDWAYGGQAAENVPSAAPAVKRFTGPAPLSRAGTLPLPPPPFSYQSFLLSTSLDAAGGPPALGVRAIFLSELGSRANWMTSYHVGVLTRLGQGPTSQLLTEFSYMFHWRWAARFLLNAGPFAYFGFRDFAAAPAPFFGVGPSVGVTVLPEGWILLPLELTLSYRVPFRLLDGQTGFRAAGGKRWEAHWIELGIGLAIMK